MHGNLQRILCHTKLSIDNYRAIITKIPHKMKDDTGILLLIITINNRLLLLSTQSITVPAHSLFCIKQSF